MAANIKKKKKINWYLREKHKDKYLDSRRI